jgi:hypothetical protein
VFVRFDNFGALAGSATRSCEHNTVNLPREIPGEAATKLRETRPAYREEPHKLLQVGATPTPATNLSFGAHSGQGLGRGSDQQCSEPTMGSEWLTSASFFRAAGAKRTSVRDFWRVSLNYPCHLLAAGTTSCPRGSTIRFLRSNSLP